MYHEFMIEDKTGREIGGWSEAESSDIDYFRGEYGDVQIKANEMVYKTNEPERFLTIDEYLEIHPNRGLQSAVMTNREFIRQLPILAAELSRKTMSKADHAIKFISQFGKKCLAETLIKNPEFEKFREIAESMEDPCNQSGLVARFLLTRGVAVVSWEEPIDWDETYLEGMRDDVVSVVKDAVRQMKCPRFAFHFRDFLEAVGASGACQLLADFKRKDVAGSSLITLGYFENHYREETAETGNQYMENFPYTGNRQIIPHNEGKGKRTKDVIACKTYGRYLFSDPVERGRSEIRSTTLFVPTPIPLSLLNHLRKSSNRWSPESKLQAEEVFELFAFNAKLMETFKNRLPYMLMAFAQTHSTEQFSRLEARMVESEARHEARHRELLMEISHLKTVARQAVAGFSTHRQITAPHTRTTADKSRLSTNDFHRRILLLRATETSHHRIMTCLGSDSRLSLSDCQLANSFAGMV